MYKYLCNSIKHKQKLRTKEEIHFLRTTMKGDLLTVMWHNGEKKKKQSCGIFYFKSVTENTGS